MRKPIVLMVVGHYRPGYKAGGILRSVENMVSHLQHEFDFRIITRDRDLGDLEPYPRISLGAWQDVGAGRVRYLASDEQSVAALRTLICATPHDVLYLNSFFDPLTIKVLLSLRFGLIPVGSVLLAPRGEFAWASLRQKYVKKKVFITIAKLIGLHRRVKWHASSEAEALELSDQYGVQQEAIHVALDLPALLDENIASPEGRAPEGLRIVFLSRVAREKNLDFALKVLAGIRGRATFDIIGPIDNHAYWAGCQDLVRRLPPRVAVRALGGLPNGQVPKALSTYDLLFLPSGGESYGHVIAEALSVGTRVLLSTNTPWRDLERKGLGWDLPLAKPEQFIQVIDQLAEATSEELRAARQRVKAGMRAILDDPTHLEANRRLLTSAASAVAQVTPSMR